MEYKHIFLALILYFYLFDNNYNTIVNYCGLFLFPLYCIIDLCVFQLTLDKKIHHYLGILICLSLYINKEQNIIYFITNYEISTEISTFYLIMKEEVEKLNSRNTKNKILLHICNCLFIFYFIYYRIINFFKIQDKVLSECWKFNYIPIFLVSFYGLFLLNLFWGVLILKKIYKLSFRNENKIQSEKNIKIICSYSNCIMLPYILYHMYFYNERKRYILYDILNISIMISSNLYHKNCFQNIQKYGFYSIFDKNIIFYYNLDTFLIKLNNYLFAFLFFVDKNIYYMLFITIIYLISYFISQIYYYFYLGNSSVPQKIVEIEQRQKIFRYMNDKIIIFNLFFQILSFLVYVLNNYNIKLMYFVIHHIIYFFLLIFVGKLKPFYEMNHILYHFIGWLMLYNNYTLISV
jgi:hypothetical protein